MAIAAVHEIERDLRRVVHPHEMLALDVADRERRILGVVELLTASAAREDVTRALSSCGAALCVIHERITPTALRSNPPS